LLNGGGLVIFPASCASLNIVRIAAALLVLVAQAVPQEDDGGNAHPDPLIS
jgi:hypothetical protein